MKRASISEAKNALSALLDRVRKGATVIIEDRGVPVARIEPIASGPGDGRLLRLQRHGIVRPPRRALAAAWFKTRPPKLLSRQTASAIVLEERRDGR